MSPESHLARSRVARNQSYVARNFIICNRVIKLENAKQCWNQHVLFVLTINSALSAPTKPIKDSDQTQLSALILTCSKCFATLSSVINTLENAIYSCPF